MKLLRNEEGNIKKISKQPGILSGISNNMVCKLLNTDGKAMPLAEH